MSVERVVLKEIPPRKIAYLKCKGSWRQIPEMLAKLTELMAGKGLIASGPVSGVYYNTPEEVDIQNLTWEVFYPVNFDVPESEEEAGFGIREITGKRMATLVHRGNYRSVGSTYRRIEEWAHEQGLKVGGPAEEVYLSGLIDSPEEQEIEIRLPVCNA